MSGHNKWSQIKHKKAKEDAKKGVAFTKLSKEITMSARKNGGDPAFNAHLRLLLEKAREENMPILNAERAILKGTGELAGMHYEEQSYEGYGPGGVAIIIDTVTDNKNRTIAELRRLFLEHNGTVVENGTVSWMFETLGVIVVAKTVTVTEDFLIELLLDYDIHTIETSENDLIIYCSVKSFLSVKQCLETASITITSAKIEKVAKNTITVSKEKEESVLELLSELQDHDDVQEVYTTLS